MPNNTTHITQYKKHIANKAQYKQHTIQTKHNTPQHSTNTHNTQTHNTPKHSETQTSNTKQTQHK